MRFNEKIRVKVQKYNTARKGSQIRITMDESTGTATVDILIGNWVSIIEFSENGVRILHQNDKFNLFFTPKEWNKIHKIINKGFKK